MMADLKQQDKTLWQKIRNWFKNPAAELQAVVDTYKGHRPDSAEGRMVADMQDMIVILESLYGDALLDASESYKAAGAQKNTTQDGDVKYSQRYLAAETNTEILEMITRVIDGDISSNNKVYLGVVPAGVANTIFGITGIDVQGFDMAIEARMVEHILKGHGKTGDADHSMQNPNHLARIQYVLFHADDIRDAGRTSTYTHFKNGKSRPAPTVLYDKRIGEKSYYVVQAVPDTKAKTLYVVSAFIGPEGYKKEASQLINAQGPDATANTDSVVASKNRIRNPEADVKEKFSFPNESGR